MVGLSPFAIAPAYGSTGVPAGSGGGSTPTYTVSTFAGLPTDATSGQRCSVTGETGLSALVCINTGTGAWSVEAVACSYALHSAVRWGAVAGRWYSSGGITVGTADGAELYDTTYGVGLVWLASRTSFVPPDIYAAGVAAYGEAKGDDATPTGWSAVGTAGSTDGTWVTLAVTGSGIGLVVSALILADTGLVAASHAYARMIVRSWATSVSPAVGNAYCTLEFCDDGKGAGAGVSTLYAASATGRWVTTEGGTYSAPTAQAAISPSMASETLYEVRKVGSIGWEARVGGAAGAWQNLARADGWTSASKALLIVAGIDQDSGVKSASLQFKHCEYMRRT